MDLKFDGDVEQVTQILRVKFCTDLLLGKLELLKLNFQI